MKCGETWMRARRWADAPRLAWLVLRESVKSFNANRDLEGAATLAYYGFLSLMPLLLLVVFVLGLIMQSSEAVQSGVQDLVAELFPSFSDAVLDDLVTLARQTVWGGVSLLVLVWSMTPFAAAFRSILEDVFKARRDLPYLKTKLVDLAAVMLLLLLFVFLVAGKVFLSLKAHNLLPEVAADSVMLKGLTTFLIVMAVMALVYVVFSPVTPRWSHLLMGAATAAILLAVIRPLFGLFLEFNPNYGYVFGSFKTIFLLIIWVYYTFAVILFGAEIMANTRRKDALLLNGFFIGKPGAGGFVGRLMNRFFQSYAIDEVVFHEGDAGVDMFVVAEGAVALSRQGVWLKTLRSGDYFGEMSMLLNAPRTATAVATGADTTLVRVNQANFEMLLHERPDIVRAILNVMATRLQEMNQQVLAMRPPATQARP